MATAQKNAEDLENQHALRISSKAQMRFGIGNRN
jgi:hypothetical protein